jgi:ATP-dependent Clp protease protease subunit
VSNISYFSFIGGIDDATAGRIAMALNSAVNEGAQGVFLSFSSWGGLVTSGVFLHNHIRAIPIPITIHATGSVESIALVVFVAAQRRVCSQHSLFLTHPAEAPASAEGKTWERLKTTLDAASAEDQRIENILRERCSIDDAIYSQRRFRDVHMTAQDALKFGITHSVEEFALPSGVRIVQI